MTLAFDTLPCPDSPLRRLDPRWKLAGLALLAAAVVAVRAWPPALAALAAAGALAALARLPVRWLLARIATVGLVLALFTLTLPFLLDGEVLCRLGPLAVTDRGVALAAALACKALALVTLLLVLLATAPLDATLKAACALRVPGLAVQLLLLTYRYVHVVADELGRLRVALRARGFRARADGHTYRTVGNVTGTLLVRSHERAERVGQAMRCRGFDGRFRSLTEFRTAPADVAFLAAAVAAAAGLVAWDLLLG
jgi:cobalt/nickel transport system permease protein